jgi:hypothetical protein
MKRSAERGEGRSEETGSDGSDKEAPRQASATRTPTTTTSTGRAMPIEAHAQGYWIKIKRKTLLRSGSTDLGTLPLSPSARPLAGIKGGALVEKGGGSRE